jgi:hypothetical protein
MIQIKRNNKVFFTLEDFGEGSKLSYQLMDHHYIILKFTTATPIYFEIGDSVEIPDFGYFELTSAYFPKHNGSDGYDYEMQMDAYYMSWKNKLCKYRPQHGANETSFKLTTTVGVHMNIILGNLKALGLTYNGKEFSVDYTTYNNKAFDVQKRFLIEYGSISILDALNSICSEDALNCEWWIDGSIIYLGYCETEGQTTFEQDVNVLSMSYSESKSTYITRLYAFGSDRNIPKGYFTGADADVTTDGIATDYLMLPNKEVDSDGFYAKDGYLENVNVVKNDKQAIEGVVMFEEEYPKVESVVSSIKTYDSTVDNEDGTKTTQTFWQVTSTDSFTNSFKESWIKSNLTLGIKFTSGALMGMEFDVSFKVIDKVNYFEIVANDTYGRTLPDGVMCPKIGDKFFLFNWDATKITDTDLIPTAQLSLFDRSKQYYLKTMISNSNFTCTMDCEKFYNDGTYDYHPLGEQVKLINDMFAQVDADGKHYRNSRIIGMEIPLDIPYDHPQYTVGEKAATSRLGKLEDKVDSITVNGMQIGGGGSGGGVYIIGTNDSTPVTDSNVYSARKANKTFLRKDVDDIAQGIIRFLQGLKLGDGEKGIDAKGNAVLGDVQMVDAVLRRIVSLGYDGATQQGFGIVDRGDGKFRLDIHDLQVWGKAVFQELDVRKLSYAGGNVYLSGSGGKIFKTEELIEVGVLKGWRCWLLADDGTTATQNMWRVGDQARCQTFGLADKQKPTRSWWRLVTAVSEENVALTDEVGNELYDGKKFGWIEIANDNCEPGSDVPMAGDTIVLDGNQNPNERNRQGVMILETTGPNTPRIVAYKGVVGYTHEGCEVFKLSPDGSRIVSTSFEWVSPTGDIIHIVNYRGEWQSGVNYGYYDQVSHGNGVWLCTNSDGSTTEPKEGNADWQLVMKAEKGETGDKGADAITIQLVGAPLIFDAGSDGIVPKGVTNYARLYVTVGEKDVSEYVGQPFFVPSEGMNVSPEDGYVIERREYNEKMAWYLGIKSDVISKVYLSDNKTEVSATSGYITFVFAYGANQYVGQLPFQVNVARYTGELTLTNNQFKISMDGLTTRMKAAEGGITNVNTRLDTEVDTLHSEITSTANDIKLEVMEQMNGNLKKAGLEVKADGITLYGDKITITNDGGNTTTALFANGKINASLIDADQIEVKHLWAKSNDGANKVGYFGNTEEDACKIGDYTVAPLFIGGATAKESPFYVTSKGAMHATSGKIGYFTISPNGELMYDDGYTDVAHRPFGLSKEALYFTHTTDHKSNDAIVWVGRTNFSESSTGTVGLLSDIWIDERVSTPTKSKACLFLSAEGYTGEDTDYKGDLMGNFAIYAKKGAYAGFRPAVRIAIENCQLTDMDCVIYVPVTGVHFTLPDNPQKGQYYKFIQGSEGKQAFWIKSNSYKMYWNGVDTNGRTSFDSGACNQTTEFIFLGDHWRVNWYREAAI